LLAAPGVGKGPTVRFLLIAACASLAAISLR
jgi:hypothetical protein